MLSKIQSDLLTMQDVKYREFNKKLVKDTKYEIIGVQVPKLRKYAKDLLKYESKPIFKDKYYEEVMVEGFYLSSIKESFEDKIKTIDRFIYKIDNWGICDSFTSSLKIIKKNRNEYYPYIKQYLKSDQEFIQRYALVCLLNHYLIPEYYNDIYKIIKTTKYHGYYSQMAGAWLLSYMFMNNYDKTIKFINENKINKLVYDVGIQKALDSYRLDKNKKNQLRKIKSSN